MIYYGCLAGYGREILADLLSATDPFSLPPAEIVERLLGMGYGPAVDQQRSEPFWQPGRTDAVEYRGQRYLVSVSRDEEAIVVQEVRDLALNAKKARPRASETGQKVAL